MSLGRWRVCRVPGSISRLCINQQWAEPTWRDTVEVGKETPLERHAASFDLFRGAKRFRLPFFPFRVWPADNRPLLLLFTRPPLRVFLRNERNGNVESIRVVDSRAFVSRVVLYYSARCVTESVIASGNVLSRRILVHVAPRANRSLRFIFFLCFINRISSTPFEEESFSSTIKMIFRIRIF